MYKQLHYSLFSFHSCLLVFTLRKHVFYRIKVDYPHLCLCYIKNRVNFHMHSMNY